MGRKQSEWRPGSPSGLLAHELLLGWLGFFAFLSIDVLIRIVGIRNQFGSPLDAWALIAIEGCRTVALVLAAWLAGAAFHGASRSRSARLFGVFVVFAAVWFAKESAFVGYPGRLQEAMAGRLLGAGVPVGILDFIFGSPEWSAWIALGALLRLSVIWPRALDPARIRRSGVRDRKGMMRSVALAGADIGEAFRKLSAGALTRGFLGSRTVWPSVITVGALHSLAPWPAARWSMTALLVIGAALAVTNLRAAFGHSTRRQRNRMAWAVTAAVMAGSAYLVAGILSFGDDAGSAVIGVVFASLTPIALIIPLAAVLRRDPPRGDVWLWRTVLGGTSSVTGATAYLLAMSALPGAASQEIPAREIVAFLTSVILVFVSAPRLRQITTRITRPAPR